MSIACVAAWILILGISPSLFSYLSGWSRLARRFPAASHARRATTRVPALVRDRYRTVWMGRIRYRGIVALSAHVDGLRISLLGGIIPCHANLLIPWERLAPSADHGRGIELKSCSDEVGRNAAHGKLWIEFSGAEARRLRDLGLLR